MNLRQDTTVDPTVLPDTPDYSLTAWITPAPSPSAADVAASPLNQYGPLAGGYAFDPGNSYSPLSYNAFSATGDNGSGGSQDIFTTIMGGLTGLLGAGTSIFNTITTADANANMAKLQTDLATTQLKNNAAVTAAQSGLDLAKLQAATALALKGQTATAAPISTNTLLLLAAGVVGVMLLTRKK